MRKTNYYTQCLSLLRDIHKKFPMYNMGKHLVAALDGHDAWSISDNELYLSLVKYQAELEYDIPHEYDDVEKIIEDGMHLDRIIYEEEEED